MKTPRLLSIILLTWGAIVPLAAAVGQGVSDETRRDYLRRRVAIIEESQRAFAHEPNGWPALVDTIKEWREVEARWREWERSAPEGTHVDVSCLIDDPRFELPGHSRELSRRAYEDEAGPDLVASLRPLIATRRVVLDPETADLGWGMMAWGLDLRPVHTLARLCETRLVLEARAGRAAAAIDAFEAALALTRAVAAQAGFVHTLFAHALADPSLRRAAALAGAGEIDEPTCRALLAAIERAPLWPEWTVTARIMSLEGQFELEHFFDDRGALCVSEFHRFRLRFRDMSRGFQEYFYPGAPGEPLEPSALFRWLSARLDEALDAAYVSPVWDGLGGSFLRRGEGAVAMDAAFRTIADWAATEPLGRERSEEVRARALACLSERDLAGRFHTREYLPACVKLVRHRDGINIELAGTRVALGVRIFEVRHGRLPRSLDELVPAILRELPIDPFSGEPLRYIAAPVGAPACERFWLYCVGADGVDDVAVGGAERFDRDALNPRLAGTDLPIVGTPVRAEGR